MSTGAVIVVAGPTASGKSALAVDLAERLGGTVINADAMQVYREMSVLTARPGVADLVRAPHRLYGVLPSAEACSAALWRERAVAEIREAHSEGRVPVVTGGTGLYLKALMQGLSPVPDVPAPIREATRARLERLGPADFHAELAVSDPAMAARLRPSDRQRLARAAEVLAATGRSLAAWQGEAAAVEGFRFLTLFLAPPRDALYAACNGRFRAMVASGALEEAAAMRDLQLDPALPAARALGLRELIGHLEGEMSLEDAIAAAQAGTRHYAKRQMTWFRNQLPDPIRIDAQYSERLRDEILSKVEHWQLTPAAGSV
jgi:tRNA dimethylallyltransferase